MGNNKKAIVCRITVCGIRNSMADLYVIAIQDLDTDSVVVASEPFILRDKADEAAEKINATLERGEHPNIELLLVQPTESIEA
tara:strand:- start:68 stop:316 length:249 start_codon:yes stop_codon:yes gene_type:complete